jgi:hypothetical protein
MNVIYQEQADHWGEEYILLKWATELLRDVPGGSSGQVEAEWNRVEDGRGRVVYTLIIRDFTGEVEASFTPEELKNPTHMRVRLYGLWSDLLRVRNRKQMQQLQEAGPTED